MLENSDMAAVAALGIYDPSAGSGAMLRLSDAVDDGLPLASLDRIAKSVAPDDSSFAYRLIAKATLARRRRAALQGKTTLSPEEGAKVARLAAVWAYAKDVWGSDEEARAFLFRPNAVLSMRRPIDVVLANEFGRPLVENILGGLKYGTGV